MFSINIAKYLQVCIIPLKWLNWRAINSKIKTLQYNRQISIIRTTFTLRKKPVVNEIRIPHTEFDKMSYRNNECRIYVGNLPPDIRTKDIQDLFHKFGKVTFVDLKNRRGPPFAFVEFEDSRYVNLDTNKSSKHSFFFWSS